MNEYFLKPVKLDLGGDGILHSSNQDLQCKSSINSTDTLHCITSNQAYMKVACQELYFRQSMIKDLLTCRQMGFYRWVMNEPTPSAYFASVLGTAGHEIIYEMHRDENFEQSFMGILKSMSRKVHQQLKALKEEGCIVNRPVKYASTAAAIADKSREYTEMIYGYQNDYRNQHFNCLMHEQPFVMLIESPYQGEENLPYLFTGCIDQGGYMNNHLTLRDIKFRDNEHRPSGKELSIDPQFTIYAMAMRHGWPACLQCKPYYTVDDLTQARELIYNGPCSQCRMKIGTEFWPMEYPTNIEMVWMRDYEILKRGTAKRKKGERRGPGYIHTIREPERLNVFMRDIIMLCHSIRNAEFFREPGKHCNFICNYAKQCFGDLRTDSSRISLELVNTIGTEEPF